MGQVTGIGGFFFRAKDPAALGAWYTEHLGITIGDQPWQQEAGTTIFAPFPHDTDYWTPPTQGWMLNVRVKDLDLMLTQLSAAGIQAETKPEWDSAVGRFARIHDPEGNPIELWEPSALVLAGPPQEG